MKLRKQSHSQQHKKTKYLICVLKEEQEVQQLYNTAERN